MSLCWYSPCGLVYFSSTTDLLLPNLFPIRYDIPFRRIQLDRQTKSQTNFKLSASSSRILIYINTECPAKTQSLHLNCERTSNYTRSNQQLANTCLKNFTETLMASNSCQKWKPYNEQMQEMERRYQNLTKLSHKFLKIKQALFQLKHKINQNFQETVLKQKP